MAWWQWCKKKWCGSAKLKSGAWRGSANQKKMAHAQHCLVVLYLHKVYEGSYDATMRNTVPLYTWINSKTIYIYLERWTLHFFVNCWFPCSQTPPHWTISQPIFRCNGFFHWRIYKEDKTKVVAAVWGDRIYSIPCRALYFLPGRFEE